MQHHCHLLLEKDTRICQAIECSSLVMWALLLPKGALLPVVCLLTLRQFGLQSP